MYIPELGIRFSSQKADGARAFLKNSPPNFRRLHYQRNSWMIFDVLFCKPFL